jgi:hypothetical protein
LPVAWGHLHILHCELLVLPIFTLLGSCFYRNLTECSPHPYSPFMI